MKKILVVILTSFLLLFPCALYADTINETLVSPKIMNSIQDGTGFQQRTSTAVCTTAAVAFATCTDTLTLTQTMLSTAYNAYATCLGPTSGQPVLTVTANTSTTIVTVTTTALTAVAATCGNIGVLIIKR